ncbi:MAG TPA: multicopper oxidase domain-containing protein, partial [Opitutaceae bacterium]|nr:multicopper oxidase domain-containing protein [Opitutaceae bacterium]
GLKMTVVQADGQHVKPVEVEEFRMGAAETYDVIVEPTDDRAYALFAETTDRSGYALGTLAPREGMMPQIPERRIRPLRTMADMGMGKSDAGNMTAGAKEMPATSSTDHSAMVGAKAASPSVDEMAGMAGMAGTNTAAKNTPSSTAPGGDPHAGMAGMSGQVSPPAPTSGHEGMAGMSGASGRSGMGAMKNNFGPGNSMVAMSPMSRANEPGTGLGEDGRRVLVYRDLVALDARPMPAPEREIVMNVTGNMERFIWGFDGKKFSESEPISLRFGERVRITFINHTMMEHPLHLHGMFMELENGAEGLAPLKHTVNVKPGEKISVLVTADAPGDWAFHCHLFYHMEAGMFRVFSVA